MRRWIPTTGVKDGRPNPRVDAQVGPSDVEGLHRVRRMNAAVQPIQTEDVHEQIGEGERDRRGLLHTRVTPEWPLAIVLLHPHTALQRQVGQRVHACVLAVIRARPSREPQGEGRRMLLLRMHRAGATVAAIVVRGCAGLPCASVEASLECVRAIPGRGIRDGTGLCDHEDEKRKKVQAHSHLSMDRLPGLIF